MVGLHVRNAAGLDLEFGTHMSMIVGYEVGDILDFSENVMILKGKDLFFGGD